MHVLHFRQNPHHEPDKTYDRHYTWVTAKRGEEMGMGMEMAMEIKRDVGMEIVMVMGVPRGW